MTSPSISLFKERLEILTDHFLSGQLDHSLAFFAEPLTIYLEGRMVHSPDRGYFGEMCREMGQALQSAGVTDVRSDITNLDEAGTSLRAIVSWQGKVKDAWAPFMSCEYFCRIKDDDFKIEMISVRDVDKAMLAQVQNAKRARYGQGATND